MDRITVLGVGNILLQDEGFGVRVVEAVLQQYCFPVNVQVLDGGTLGMELLRYLMDTDKLIIIDAVLGNLPPGSVYEFENDSVKSYFKEKVSMHELGIQDVLSVLDILENPVREIVVLGVQPAIMDVGLELTPVIAEKIPVVMNRLIAILNSWQVEVMESGEYTTNIHSCESDA